jgi:energy-coupling factor transporter ATP-binding protein EcfA2
MSDNLNKDVTIGRQFLRYINLVADLGRSDALNGYICQESARNLISNMAHHLNQTEQRAFTWTGPYGGGKSSLALVLGSLVSPNKPLREEAKKILHEHRIEKLPIVDDKGRVQGLITSTDLRKIQDHPNSLKDKKGRIIGRAWFQSSNRDCLKVLLKIHNK